MKGTRPLSTDEIIAVSQQFNGTRKTLHSLEKFSTGDLITELQARGVDLSSAIAQMQKERQPKLAAVAGSKVVAFPKRE